MLDRIAQYEISGEIGQGGFGRVYKAYDPKVGRDVAIKVLNDTHDPELINRFRVEAAAAGNLRHANIVTIYEFGEWQGTHYLVMEYLPGLDLNRRIKEKPGISVLEAITIMNQVALGLGYAHNHGVVHRDVKPANIMVLPDGVAKIMDFGIARLTSDSQPHLTKSGFILGTLPYLAPEQFEQGRSYDALCDIWAYGVVYYELLTGENPFKGGGDASIMYRITAVDPPPISATRAECPIELERLVHRLLMRNRDDRYQSLEDVVFDSESILQRLRKDRAGDLQKVVERLIEQEQLEQAQLAVRQMLELDPSNEQARRWRDELRKQARDRGIKTRVQNLVVSAESEVAQQRFEEARQLLQSALDLEPGNIALQKRIDWIRQALERHQHVQTLLAQARQDVDAQNLSNALFLASEAAAADPQNESARLLVRQIQELADRRDEQRKLASGLATADDLIQSGSYEQALVVLADLRNTFPDQPDVLEKINDVRRRQANDRFNARLAQGISSARDLMQTERFSEAVDLLESLCLEFQSDQGIRELLALAIKQRDAHKQRVECESIGRQAWGLAKAGEFEPALSLVDDGLRLFPGDPILARVRGAIRSAQAGRVEESEVQSVIELSRALGEGLQFNDAIAALQNALRRFPSRAELQELIGELQQQQTRHLQEAEEQARAERGREQERLSLEPSTSSGALSYGANVVPPSDPPAVDARRHRAFDPRQREGQFLLDGSPQNPTRKKLLLWGCVAGASVVVVIASVTWMSKPSPHSERSPKIEAEATPSQFKPEVKAEATVEATDNKSEKKTSPPTEVRSAPGAVKTGVPIPRSDRQEDTKAKEGPATAVRPAPASQPEITKAPAHEEPRKPPDLQPPPTVNTSPSAVETVSKKPWRGDDSGQMMWRGGSIAPGTTMEIKPGALQGAHNFPWLTETKVQVQVVSPQNVTVEVQPSRANNWNSIRLRNNGTQPVSVVTLSWQIVE